MRFTIYICIMLALTVASIAGTRIDATIVVDDVKRQFVVSIPDGNVSEGGYPLVFVFHGTSGDGEKFYNISGWKEKGEKEKFVTVFPSSLEYCFYNWETGNPNKTSKWNCGESQEKKCEGEELDKDDVKFIRKVVDTLLKTLPIDPSRIYASGFSNGGGFTSKLAIEMSDVFAALSSSSAFLHELDSAAPKRYIPFVCSIGNLDNRVTTKIGKPNIPFNDSCLAIFYGNLNRYLGAFNLTQNYSKDSTSLSLTYTFTEQKNSNIKNSKDNHVQASERYFSFTLLKDLTHEYPNGANYPISAANVIWEFFKKYRLEATPVDETESSISALIYPNPAESFIIIKGEGNTKLILHSLLGQIIYSVMAVNGERVNLPELPRGIYIAEITCGGKTSYERIVIR